MNIVCKFSSFLRITSYFNIHVAPSFIRFILFFLYMDKIRLIYHSNEGLDPKYQLSLQETLSFKATLDSSHLNSLQSIMAQTNTCK